MTSPDLIPVFDGHNDVLLRLVRRRGGNPEQAFLAGENVGHLDWPRMRAGGFAGGFFAIFVPSGDDPGVDEMMAKPHYDVPLPAELELSPAQQVTLQMASLLLRIERASNEEVMVCRTAEEIRRCLKTGMLAAVMHIEGAEAIDPEFRMLDVLYGAGLRSIEYLRPRRSVPLSLEPRHRAGTNGPWSRPGAGLQRPQDHARPVASQ
jgi:membrane dipeptidase